MDELWMNNRAEERRHSVVKSYPLVFPSETMTSTKPLPGILIGGYFRNGF